MKYQTSKLIALLAMVVALTFAACTDDKPKAEGSATDTMAVASVDTAAVSSAPQTFTDIHAVVTGVQPSTKMVMLNHEKIGDWMEAMEMPFPVADSAMLNQVKLGDSVLFTVKVTDNQGLITELKKK
jgi:Cu/Ag efflux protein CusF